MTTEFRRLLDEFQEWCRVTEWKDFCDGWESFFPAWNSLVHEASLAMQSDDKETYALVEIVWRADEETEDLADLVKEQADQVVNCLRYLAASVDPVVRLHTARVLGYASSEVPLLLQLLEDPDDNVRRSAIRSIWQADRDAAVRCAIPIASSSEQSEATRTIASAIIEGTIDGPFLKFPSIDPGVTEEEWVAWAESTFRDWGDGFEWTRSRTRLCRPHRGQFLAVMLGADVASPNSYMSRYTLRFLRLDHTYSATATVRLHHVASREQLEEHDRIQRRVFDDQSARFAAVYARPSASKPLRLPNTAPGDVERSSAPDEILESPSESSFVVEPEFHFVWPNHLEWWREFIVAHLPEWIESAEEKLFKRWELFRRWKFFSR